MGFATTLEKDFEMNAMTSITADHSMQDTLEKQRAAFLAAEVLTLAQRKAKLGDLKKAILSRRTAIQEAIAADFGNRSNHETDVMEIMPVTQGIDYLRSRIGKWMRPTRHHVAMQYRPARARTIMQPLGVIGIISPWNYPLALTLTPLATAIAAGNRVMIKPSELTPRTSALMAQMLGEIFDEDEVAVVTGGPEIGASFAGLAFDHLFFTGSTPVGKHIMHAAADNLVPVTLELGGKSPVIVDRDYPIERAAKALVYGKLSNAGQTCVAPDYVFIDEGRVERFVDAFVAEAKRAYPDGPADKGFTTIINQRHHDRLKELLSDAEAKGARIIQVGTAPDLGRPRSIPPTIIVGATPDMKVMQGEIFGPILPVVTHRTIDDAIDRINAGDRPLALYVFSDNRQVTDRILTRTTSGSAVVNDTLLQFVQDDMPFGGVGASGMGAYHGEQGFRTFSHAKSVLVQSRFSMVGIMRAPFGRLADLTLRFMLP